MVVITAPYYGSNLIHLPTMKLSCKTTCPVCIAGCHKRLCFGSKQTSLIGLQSKPRKLELRAGGGRGFEGSDDEDENNENGGEAEENVSFWERQDTRQKMKELEEMSDLVKEAEKLQEESVKAEAEEQAAAKEKESEEEKRKMLREELAKRAKEQAEKRKTAEVMFQMGQRAYGKGLYNKAVELLEGALSNVTGVSLVGGEIQLWLAMAYEAHNRHDDCIALYKILEKTHPIKAIRQKAADLRYILEAPKLKITQDEMVSIPLIDYDLNYSSSNSKRSWSQMYRSRRKVTGTKQTSPSRDYFQDFLVWKRPKWERSPLFWVAVAVWLTLVGMALVFQD